MKFGGVYKITNMLTGEIYIGSSGYIHTRVVDHFSALRRNKGKHPRLQSNWNEYGEAAFRVEVVERVPNPEELKEREQYWTDRLSPELNASMNSRGAGEARWETLRRRRIEDGSESSCYHRYLLTAPDGRQMCTDNLTRFCEYFGLERSGLSAVAAGKYRHSQDWRCQSLDSKVELKSPIPRKKRSAKYRGYLMTDPKGVQMCTTNLTEFSNHFGLTRENLLKVARGQRKSANGWKCEFIEF